MSDENCPYCGSELEVAAVACAKCGTAIPQPEFPAEQPCKRSRGTRKEWITFLALLLLPGLVSPIFALKNEDWWLGVAICGTLPGAIYGGIWLSGFVTPILGWRIVATVAFSIALYLTIVIGTVFVGCLVQPTTRSG